MQYLWCIHVNKWVHSVSKATLVYFSKIHDFCWSSGCTCSVCVAVTSQGGVRILHRGTRGCAPEHLTRIYNRKPSVGFWRILPAAARATTCVFHGVSRLIHGGFLLSAAELPARCWGTPSGERTCPRRKTQMPVRSEYNLVETHAGAEFWTFIYLLLFLWDFDRWKVEIEKKIKKEKKYNLTVICTRKREQFGCSFPCFSFFYVMLAQQWCSQRHVQGPTK